MPRAVQRATAADVPYSISSGCATTQSTRWKDSSGRAGNVMPVILPRSGGRRHPLCNQVIGLLMADQGDGSVMVAGNAHPPVDGGTILITGASAGIGRELAIQLAPRASVLILLARRAGRLEELRGSLLARHPQLQVLTLPVDLSDEDDVDRALAKAGQQGGAVDVLVNNAGIGD